MANKSTGEWIGVAEATRLLGISRVGVEAMIRRRVVTTKKFPGLAGYRLLKSDVERIARDSVTPALKMQEAAGA